MSVSKDEQEHGCCLQAIKNGNIPQVLQHLNGGLDINMSTTQSHSTLLQAAAEYQNSDLTELLIMRGAEVDGYYPVKTSFYFSTPLHISVGPAEWGRPTNPKCVELLIRHKASVSSPKILGHAVNYADILSIQLLLEAKASCKMPYKCLTPLTWARNMGRRDIAELLIAHGAERPEETNQDQLPQAPGGPTA